MNISFEGRRILITGAGQGIGKDLALRLSKAKATVVALSKTKENLDALTKLDPKIQTVCCDLRDWDATRKAVQSVLPIDLLVNNAGVGKFASCLTATPEQFDHEFDVNVKALLNVTQIVGKNMIERKVAGSIVNISSQTSKIPINGSIIYSSSKAAANMLTKCLARELGPHNIRVNCILPTVVASTDLGKKCIGDKTRCEALKSRIPLARFAEINEVFDAVSFLLSDKSSIITGIELPIDGGYLTS